MRPDDTFLVLTQAQLGKEIGVAQSQVARIENSSHEVSLDLVLRVLLSVAPKGVEMKVGGKRKTASVKAA